MTLAWMRRPLVRRVTAGLLTLALAAPPSFGADVMGTVKGMVPMLGFSVSGKPGPYMKQISKRKIEPMKVGADGALGFGGDSRGEFQSARIDLPVTRKMVEDFLAQEDQHWPYQKPPKIKVHILADGKYGPYALPDGSIAVPIGFLYRAESDDEVAFVLSHEYAHLAVAHFGRSDRMMTQRKVVTTLAKIYSWCVALSEVRAQKVGDETKLSLADVKRVEAARDRAVSDKKALDWVLNNLVEPAWQRRQEDEADALGFDLARELGYSPQDAAGGAFQKITDDDASRLDLVNGLQVRIKDAFGESMAKYGKETADTGNASNLFNDMGKGMVSGLKSLTMKSIASFLSAKHRPPAERQKGLSEYAETAYPQPAALTEAKTVWLDKVRNTKEFIAAKKAVLAMQSARAAIEGKETAPTPADIAKAEQQIKIAMATPPFSTLPLFANEAAKIYTLKGDAKSAERFYTVADASKDQTLEGFKAHVQFAMDNRGDYARAAQVIALYQSRSNTVRDFLPQLIRINLKLKKNDEAAKYLDQCLATEDDDLIDACSLAAYGVDDPLFKSLPIGMQEKLQAKARKGVSQQAMFTGLGDMFKSWDKSSDKD